MASCSQVSSLLQAHIDGELGHAEKSILEQHLRECKACQEELLEQSTCSAQIFECLSGDRLPDSLRSRVLAHLPEMDPALRQGSHPTDPQYARKRARSTAFPKFLIAAAAAILISTAGYVFSSAAPPAPLQPAVGMVTFSENGDVLSRPVHDTTFRVAALKSLVRPGDQFETLAEGRLAISLIARSIMKANYNSGFTVHDNRRVSVEEGLTYFDVGEDKRLFNVETPNGEILVFGTAFVVEVKQGSTTVTVTEGDILVANDVGKTGVSEGNQLVFHKGKPLDKPYPVDADAIAAWAYDIVPHADAMALFLQTLELRQSLHASIPAVPVYAVWDLADRRVEEIQLSWTPDGNPSGHCGYIVHVADGNGALLYIDTLDSALFNDVSRGEASLVIPGGPITGVEVVHIKLVPDHTDGSIETNMEVSVVAEPI